MLYDLIRKNRSYRRFDETYLIDETTLRELVELARLSPSAANRQPLKYRLITDAETRAKVFPLLRWAGYLKTWPGPAEGERPTAYIVVLGDTSITPNVGVDPGIAMQSIMLGATEKGLGGCIIASFDKEALRQMLQVPERYELLYVLALGKPVEQVVIETVGPEGDIKYWRDEQQVHHVPKRSLDELIV